MAKAKKRTSISLKVISLIVGNLVSLGMVLTAVAFGQVNKSLKDYSFDELKTSQQFFSDAVSTKAHVLERDLKWLMSYLNSRPVAERGMMLVTGRINDDFTFDKMAYLNTYGGGGRFNATNGNYEIPQWFTAKVEAEGIYTDIVAANDEVYLLSGMTYVNAIKEITGTIYLRDVISSDEVVQDIKEATKREITIFNGYKRGFTTMEGMKNTEIADKSLIDRVQNGEDVFATAKVGKQDYSCCYFPLKDKRGQIVCVAFLGESLETIYKTRQGIVVGLGVVTLFLVLGLVILGIFFLGYTLVKPLKRVEDAVANLSSGQADLTYRLPVRGNDELTTISEHINTFIDTLLDIVREIEHAQNSLETIGSKLDISSENSTSATTQIMGNIESVVERSKEQSQNVAETSNVLNSAQKEVDGLGMLIETQASGITESSASIEEMMGNINSVNNSVQHMEKLFQNLTSTVNDGKQKLTDMVKKVETISKQSVALMQANSVIAKIASQTNLLAMNAAIEAAHAGDSGRGFAVVADEIRDLAENSSKQSASIKQELKEISTSINDVVVSSSFTEKAFGEIVEEINTTSNLITEIGNAMMEQSAGSQQVLQALETIKDQTEQVRSMSGTMKESFKTINETMNGVSSLSASILESMDEMNKGSKVISTSAQDVNNLAGDTSKNIDDLKQLLDKFKTA